MDGDRRLPRLKVSDVIIHCLVEIGVKFVFVVPGGFSMHLNDSLNHSFITPVYCLHEAGAGWAACGYAAYSGQLGVCLVTSGPGSLNILTPVASAWQDSLPLLVISGDAKTENIKLREQYQLRQAGAQDVDIIRIVKPITKHADRLVSPYAIRERLTNVIDIATTPRKGSVWLSVPLNIQEMNYE